MLQTLFPIYKYLRAIIIITLPILLVLFSINIGLTDARLHKESLKNSNFYNDLSGEVKKYDPGFDSKNAFFSLVVDSTIDDFASPGWLQNLAEKNIDQTTAWMRGDQENWSLYLPTQDVNLAVTNELDAKTREFNEKYSSNIPACSEAQEIDLKQNGFKSDQNFCLPNTVKEGSQSLSEFFAFDKNNTNQNFFDTIYKSDLADTLAYRDQNWYNWFNTLRNYFAWQRRIVPGLLAIVILAAGLLVLLAKVMGKKPLNELRSIFVYTGFSTLVIALSLVLLIGGGSYLTSSFGMQFLPSFNTPRIASIISWQLTLFSFNLVSAAVYTALVLFVVSLVTWFLARLGFLKFIKLKNQKLVATTFPRNVQNKTLDGQFKQSNTVPNQSSTAGFLNLEIPENFEMPLLAASETNTFNVDVLSQTPQIESKINEQYPTPLMQKTNQELVDRFSSSNTLLDSNTPISESTESAVVANDYAEEIPVPAPKPAPTQIHPSQPANSDTPKKPLAWF